MHAGTDFRVPPSLHTSREICFMWASDLFSVPAMHAIPTAAHDKTATSESSAPACIICSSAEKARDIAAREMMFGWRHPFTYRECGACGSLQILEAPKNLSDYYAGGYYSLALPPPKRASVARRLWARWVLGGAGPFADGVTRAIYRKTPFFRWLWLADLRLDSAILDVGCGSGGLLRRMQRYGFSNLAGVDPYTAVEVAEPGLRIARTDIDRVDGKMDFVMFNHVLEHVADPKAALLKARSLLYPGGRILVRVPVAGSLLQREYGADWYNLDAPRHLVIPSQRGMERLAQDVGMRIMHVEFDSEEASFANSDHYRRNVSMNEAPKMSKDVRRKYRRLANEYNRRGEGDLGLFLLGR